MDSLERLRALCIGLPEVSERLSHSEPTWFVREKKSFVMFADHHHDDRVAFWCAAPPGAQEFFIESDPSRFFKPPYVGPRGWLGVRLDVEGDWSEIEDIVINAYCAVAPKGLVARLEALSERAAEAIEETRTPR